MADNPAPAKETAKKETAKAGDELLAAAQAKVPHITRELCAQFGLGDDYLERLAAGLEPGPPNIGPDPTVDLYYNSGMWQVTPKGADPDTILEGKYR